MISKNHLGLATEIIIMAIVISVILLFVGIGLLVVIHACVVGRSMRNNSAIERGNNNNPGTMTEDDIEKLPSYDFIAKSKGSSPADCAVCLDNFKVGDKCRQLPICKHSFHAQCVDEWILKKPVCPICRTTADSRRLAIGEESSHFSDDTQTTEFSSNLSDASIQMSAGNSLGIEIRDNTLLSNVYGTHEFTQNQTDLVETHLSSSLDFTSEP